MDKADSKEMYTHVHFIYVVSLLEKIYTMTVCVSCMCVQGTPSEGLRSCRKGQAVLTEKADSICSSVHHNRTNNGRSAQSGNTTYHAWPRDTATLSQKYPMTLQASRLSWENTKMERIPENILTQPFPYWP